VGGLDGAVREVGRLLAGDLVDAAISPSNTEPLIDGTLIATPSADPAWYRPDGGSD